MFYADRNVRPCTILGYTLTTFPKSLMHNQSNRNLWHNCKRNNKTHKTTPPNCEQKDLAPVSLQAAGAEAKHQTPEESRDQFIQICNQLCLATTVARYEILKGKLEEMTRRTPYLWSWIEWWDIRKAQIFGPFCHSCLLGCNLSEQGNKCWKPTGTMRLVHAACDDVITMMFQ